MSGTSPVERPHFFLDGRGNKILAVLVVALLVALVKPWGLAGTGVPEPSRASVAILASPSSPPTPNPADLVSRVYDPLIFGDKELRPTWGLWPAGYLVSFGFAMRAEPSGPPKGGPVPSAARSDPATPVWPAAIDIPNGNHLLLIGVNTPNGYSVDAIHLIRRESDGRTTTVAVEHLPSPWPSHFTVIAIDSGGGTTRADFWAPGDYQLDLTIDPGPIQRSVEVRVEGPAVLPSAAPWGSSLRP
ncbi:MAG: hypothetical protein QOE66_1757 [Chloroflexota bacterium]|jgi:hypothetical protein|nr:hypothetical protein [Chloroflexota bacterium]